MINYIINKLFYGFLTLFGVITIVFLLFTVLPGDPARMMLDQKEDPEQLAQIRKNLGLDQPVWKQYMYYLNDLSPISFHNTNPKETTYTSLSSEKYDYKTIANFGDEAVVIKKPFYEIHFKNKENQLLQLLPKHYQTLLF